MVFYNDGGVKRDEREPRRLLDLGTASGIGMIKMLEDNPLTDEPIVVEYDFSWM